MPVVVKILSQIRWTQAERLSFLTSSIADLKFFIKRPPLYDKKSIYDKSIDCKGFFSP